MSAADGAEPAGVPTKLYEFYGHFKPFKSYDGAPVKEFAPYQVAIWNDRFGGYHQRNYVRSPGAGLTKLLLLEALNVILSSGRRTEVLVIVADQFTAQRRRDELVEMLEGSTYSGCLVDPDDWSQDMRAQAMLHRFGVVVRPPGAPDKNVCGLSFESVIGFDASSVNMHHVLVLDAMESAFPKDKISWGLANASSTTVLTRGRMVVAMVPRHPYYNLHRRFPNVNGVEPGSLYERNGALVRRIPTSLAVDAGIIQRRDDNTEMELMGREVRDAKYPEGAG